MQPYPEFRDRLVKLLALLGSTSDGEVLAAARKAAEMVQASGRSWSDLIPASIGHGPTAHALAVGDGPVETISRDGWPDIDPPHGRAWADTVLWLIQRRRDHAAIRDASWLDDLATAIETARRTGGNNPTTYRQAQMLRDLHARVTAI